MMMITWKLFSAVQKMTTAMTKVGITQSSGKVYTGANKKKINGRYYMFINHGQMLYEWINGTAKTVSSNAQLDGVASAGSASVEDRYHNAVEEDTESRRLV